MTTTVTSIECGGARIHAHCRHLATVVTIRGDIDALNVGRVGEYLQRFVRGNSPLVLDLAGVSGFAVAGLSLLSGFDEECRDADVQWMLIPSPAVRASVGDAFPTTRSVPEALRTLAEAIDTRRQLVLPLIKKTA